MAGAYGPVRSEYTAVLYGRLALHYLHLFTSPNKYHANPQRRITRRNAHEDTIELDRTQRRELDIQMLLAEGRQAWEGNRLRHVVRSEALSGTSCPKEMGGRQFRR